MSKAIKEIYGAVIVNGEKFDCNEILTIEDLSSSTYGEGWVYNGDLDADECDIFVTYSDGSETSFAGITGLPDFLSSRKVTI